MSVPSSILEMGQRAGIPKSPLERILRPRMSSRRITSSCSTVANSQHGVTGTDALIVG
jgi:hypothetical protein